MVPDTDALPRVRRQTCARGVHRDWWADTDGGKPHGCPWCEIDDLKVRLEQRTTGGFR